MKITKEQSEKLDKLDFCDECGAILLENDGGTLLTIVSKKEGSEGSSTSLKYPKKERLCDRCLEKKWKEIESII